MAHLPSPDYQHLRNNVYAALRAWQCFDNTQENLLADLILVQEQYRTLTNTSPPNLRLGTNQVLLTHINELEKYNQPGAGILSMRFIDRDIIQKVANKLHLSEDQVKRQQRKAIDLLTRLLLANEMAARHMRAQTMEASLTPPTYTDLFGVDKLDNMLVKQLLLSNSPWVVAIVGIGGLGKTALADKVTRRVIREFYFAEVIWLRIEHQTMSGRSSSPRLTFEGLTAELAKRLWPDIVDELPPQQRLAQVRQALKAKPYLIIIDNLESEADTAYLLERLNDLSEPSKFLLTSRSRLSELATVFNFSLDELSFQDAANLIRHHAQDIGLSHEATITDGDIETIYAVTGGNPLALKLVVSLLDTLPLSQILLNLKQGRQGSVEDLYRHIYWQTWQILSTEAQQLFKAMPLVAASGGSIEYLKRISGLADTQLWPALQGLRNRSLLEVRGTVQEKKYGIHRLTETFLQTEIIHWPEDEAT